MYAVIETGGQQHRVSPGDVIQVQKIGPGDGGEISLDKVLLVSKYCSFPRMTIQSFSANPILKTLL